MTTLARRSQRSTNIWPGFVDALATLLMVIIFLLMVFVLAQFFLGEALSGRDAALRKLQTQISDMSNLLSLERKANDDMRLNVAQLSEELQGVANLIENILIKKQRPNICQCSPVMSPSVLQIYTRLRKSWTLSPLQILILGSRNLLNGIWIINKI